MPLRITLYNVCVLKLVEPNFSYCSDNNKDWMSVESLKEWIKSNKDKIGKI